MDALGCPVGDNGGPPATQPAALRAAASTTCFRARIRRAYSHSAADLPHLDAILSQADCDPWLTRETEVLCEPAYVAGLKAAVICAGVLPSTVTDWVWVPSVSCHASTV